jgi:hypothetical protein
MDSAPGASFSFDWSFPCALVWGIVVLVSLAGWGAAIGRWLVPAWEDERLEWGLSAAWGMTAFLVLSGILMMLSAFSAAFVGLFLLAGLALFLRLFVGPGRPRIGPLPESGILKVALLGVCFFAVVKYVAAAAVHWFNQYDDFPAYFKHAKMLFDTGTLSDPFDFRLLGSLGGQQVLSTLVLAFLPWKYGNLLDIGIALLIMVAMACETVRGHDTRAWITRLALAAFALLFCMPRTNTASELTGVVLTLALLRSFDLVASRRSTGFRAAILLAAVVMAAGTLRCNYVFFIGMLTACFFLHRLWESRKVLREPLQEMLMTFSLTVAFFTPWSVVQYRSSGALIYPLIKGNQRPEFDVYTIHLTPLGFLEFAGGFLVTCNYLLLFLPVFLLQAGRPRTVSLIYAGAILLPAIPCIFYLTNANDVEIYRYLAPLALAFCFYTLGALAQQLVATPDNQEMRRATMLHWTLAGILLPVILVTAILPVENRNALRTDARYLKRNPNIFNANNPMNNLVNHPVFMQDAAADYRGAFARIPTEDKTMVALDFPFLLDFHAHRIVSIDFPGMVSPPPGFPCFQGAEAVKQYLRTQGIRYIAHVPFDHLEGMYSRYMQLHGKWNNVTPVIAKYQLDFMDNIEQLATTNRVIYSSPNIVVIDLAD